MFLGHFASSKIPIRPWSKEKQAAFEVEYAEQERQQESNRKLIAESITPEEEMADMLETPSEQEYCLSMWDSDEEIQRVLLSRAEYIALKGELSKLRGFPLSGPLLDRRSAKDLIHLIQCQPSPL